MAHYTKEDILRIVEEEDVEFIRMQFTDMFGVLKNLAITSSQLPRALDNKCTVDGYSIAGMAEIEEADMYLIPDLDTFTIFPWRPQQGKVARLICDVVDINGKPNVNDSRYILKQVLREAADMGYTFDVGPECEFFLFETDDNGQPTTITHEHAGIFDLGPLDQGENLRRDIVLMLEEMGFDILTSHHEIAKSQHEIDFRYDEALKTADNVMTFKLVVKSLAKRHGKYATFMPKPTSGEEGSGMHINMSLHCGARNIFYDESDELHLSKEAYWFMGGIMKHIGAITAITNPLVNSYKRLIPGYDAPVYVAWSRANKSSLIRVPTNVGQHTRIELRSPDPAANPYLALAVCLKAGLDGIKNQIMPPARVDRNINAMTDAEREAMDIHALPLTLIEALYALKADEVIMDALGSSFADKYVEAKKQEWHEYSRQVTRWEVEHYLYKH